MSVDHARFILAAYGITGVAIVAMIVSIVLDHRALKKALARFPARDGDPT
jgi:heme exporter protein CcmD